MGASESTPATPTCKPLLNKHLAHVSDPRSPTAGILRTPIEVENSPQVSPLAEPKEDGLVADDQDLNWDPRSPTLGISRTPMKAVMADTVDCLVKRLSEAFIAETVEEKLLLAEPHHQGLESEVAFVPEEASREETASVEASQGSPLLAEEGKEEQLSSSTSVAASARPALSVGVPCSTGSKQARRRANSKILAMSTAAGRSPLSILQDDNSPNSLSSYQGKRHPSLSDNQREHKEGVLSSGRSLKVGSSTWDSLSKENRQCHLVEN
ncbi:cell division cycle-associated protein 3 isoform X2 [Hemicordylus capensis]|nr:cell division cycle-associated protein 3 isoform X2 [Hemicordylus capensis]XP_053146808.1 cell division cycle-associated protein 3 isoform X2 [Hemicordylus capensis]XP_053146809.1 cell division cycle-associated protein 3 isoform X2 [Hemicordylus capensis]XP_053146810.1 cell division cycle-associated protein 3 isoform X2 [Hemicordylus capensis]XP_053146811.1 cell division cycle-associated protein 3 isoform X2 [Hemicordylus capensis]XP_053146812.1 cell division cycle-associated protein 3 isof